MATVLVVDDRATNREIARLTLDEGGYRVIEAAAGPQALDLARRLHPDVVLADVIMPGMDGYEFVEALRADAGTAGIPVLLYTANYAPDEAGPLAEAYGVARVVAKSADPAELLAAVGEALHHRPEPIAGPVTSEHLRTVNAKLVEKVLALDESEARFQALADLSPVGIVSGGIDLQASYVNPRLLDITGAAGHDLLRLGWLRCVPEEHRDGLRAAANADFSGRIHLGEGRDRWLHTRIRVTQEEGDETGFVATVDDVTAVVEAEQLRHLAERRRIAERFDGLARLSGAIAHDFNNILNIILSFSEFTQESLREAVDTRLTAADAEPMLGDLEKIHRAGQRAAHLAHQLLTFGGREVVQPSVVRPNAVVAEVRDLAEATVGKQVRIETRLDPAVRNIRIDGDQLTQALLNLAINARDAMPDGGALTLETGNAGPNLPAGLPAGAYIRIAVRDEGVGMPPEVLDRAVEPFFSTKPKGHGTGLGLATAFGIVRQAGGELVIDSAPGRGTTVSLYLPATAELLPGRTPQAAPAASAGHTILLAEDEDGVREVVTRILTRDGYRVLAAANGQEALEIARRHDGPIDGVLSDVVMPHLNGPELAAALRTVLPGVPVLYMSGFAGPLMTDQGLLEPGVTVVGKPFTRAELLAAVHDRLAGDHSR
jgi:PAS domain S-box-containing protein